MFQGGAYADDDEVLAELFTLMENVRTGAKEISAERDDKRMPDEIGKLADAGELLQSALEKYEKEGTAVDAGLINAFSGALEDAEKSRE